MKSINFSYDNALEFIQREHIGAYKERTIAAIQDLHNKTGKGNDFLGWLDLASSITEEEIKDIEATASLLQENCEVVVVIGIGGSYLGAKAVIDALSNSFDWLQKDRTAPVILYAGQNIGEDYLYELQQYLTGKKFGIISISKSGTTTEPALAFRLLKQQLEEQAGKDFAKKSIVAVTDKSRGALRILADQEGLKTFVLEDSVGGRYSVLTPVGLLPIAVAGFDIRALIDGAKNMETVCGVDTKFEDNLAVQYAVVRNILYNDGKKIEILVNYNPKLQYFSEWWKQLYGESEGKEHKGIFPASVNFTTDLHSMGQWIQEGERTIFETVISVAQSDYKVLVPSTTDDLDGLNYLAGKRVDYVNKMAELGTTLAHIDGQVPNLHILLPKLNEYHIGELIYFFEKACGISGYLLDVNPFDQPGVEAYKSNMFALLEKPGHEEETRKIKEKLKK